MNRILLALVALVASAGVSAAQVVFDYAPPALGSSEVIKRNDLAAELTGIDGDKQDADTELTCLAGVTSAADKVPYFTGVGTCATADFSAAIRTLITTPSAANLAAMLSDDASGWTTFGTTPSSANLRSLMTDEVDTGVLVFLGTPADDQVPVGDSASDTTWRTVPDSDLATQKLQYDQATNTFSAGTDDDIPDAGDFTNLSATAPITQSGGTISTSMSTSRLIGRTTASTGVMEEITVGAMLSFSSQTLNIGDVELTSIAGLTSAADKLPYYTGSGAAALADFPAAMRTFLTTPSVANLGALLTTEAAGWDTFQNSPSMANLGAFLTDDASGWTTFGTTPSSANLRSLLTDEVGTGAAMFGMISTMSDDLSCTGSQVVRRNSGDTAFECATLADDDVPEAGDFTNLSATSPITQSGGTISTSIATARIVGRTTASAGVMEELTVDDDITLASGVLGPVVDLTCTGCIGATEIAGLDAGDTTTGAFADARVDGSLEADEVNPTLGTQTQGNFVATVTASTGIAVTGADAEGSTKTVAFDYSDAGSDPALGADECRFTSNATVGRFIVCEGDTANASESGIFFTEPTADRVMTIPNADSNPVQPLTCGGTDKVSAISSTGTITCTADSGAGGGIANVVEDLTPQLGGALDTNGFNIELGTANTDTSLTRSSAGIAAVEGNVLTRTIDIDTSSELRGVLTDEVGTGGAMFGLISTMNDDLACTGSQYVRRNSGDTAFECATITALVSGDIDTSSELRGILTDEAGTGAAMFGLTTTMADDLSCTGSQVVRRNAGDTAFECVTLAGGGNVTGPGSSTDNAVARYDGTGGVTLQNSNMTVADAGDVSTFSTDTGATAGPIIDIYRDSASPAASDLAGAVDFSGEDSAGGKDTYARVGGYIVDPTSTSEDGGLSFSMAKAGTLTEVMSLTSDGDWRVSSSTQFYPLAFFSNTANDSFGGYFSFRKSRAGGVVSSGDLLGTMQFKGNDGTDHETATEIASEVDGTPGNDDMPGRLIFKTTADGATSPTERLRLDSNGLVTVATNGTLVGAATTTTTSPITLQGGTLETTPDDGDMEQDDNATYLTTDAGNRGYISAKHFIRADSTRTFTSNTSEQAIFNSPTNGRLTLETGTYWMQCEISMGSMSATGGNASFDILGAGGATLGSVLYHVVGVDGNTNTAATQTGSTNTAAQTPASAVTAGTGTTMNFSVRGSFEVTGAGTIQPAMTLVTAAAAVIAVGSYCGFERIGSTSVVSVGQWD